MLQTASRNEIVCKNILSHILKISSYNTCIKFHFNLWASSNADISCLNMYAELSIGTRTWFVQASMSKIQGLFKDF